MTAAVDTARGFILGVALLAVTVSALPVAAHNSTVYFNPITWDDISSIGFRIDASIPGDPGSNFEDRIHDARGRWNTSCCIGSFQFTDTGNGDISSTNQPCSWKEDVVDIWVFYTPTGGPIAAVIRCEVLHQQQDFTDIHSALVDFDADETWYAQDNQDVPAGAFSVEDIATHELGHLSGVYRQGNASLGTAGGHWEYPSAMCDFFGEESDWTMCGGGAVRGEAFAIPLETHDIDTFQDFY
jgi:hypothetical protein